MKILKKQYYKFGDQYANFAELIKLFIAKNQNILKKNIAIYKYFNIDFRILIMHCLAQKIILKSISMKNIWNSL